jgi:hypothetical protein
MLRNFDRSDVLAAPAPQLRRVSPRDAICGVLEEWKACAEQRSAFPLAEPRSAQSDKATNCLPPSFCQGFSEISTVPTSSRRSRHNLGGCPRPRRHLRCGKNGRLAQSNALHFRAGDRHQSNSRESQNCGLRQPADRKGFYNFRRQFPTCRKERRELADEGDKTSRLSPTPSIAGVWQ